jgi:MFS family permease
MALSFSVLRLRDFRILLASRVLGTMALQAQAIIVGWQIYSLTHSPFMLGLTGLAEAIPALSCALFAGHVVDNNRPHVIFLSCIGALVLNMLFLFLLAGGVLPVSQAQLVPFILGGVFFSGLARSFIIPASFALQPQVIPRADIPAASAWLSGGFQLGIIVGPAIAGIVYGGYGSHIAWMLPVSLMTIEFILACTLSGIHRKFRSTSKREPAIASMKAGLAFIINNKILLCVMSLDMFAVLFGGAVAMLPAYADQILHVGAHGLGALRAAPALGAIVSALVLATSPMKRIRASTLLWVVAGFGVCIIGFGMSTVFWLSMALLVLSGGFDSVSMVIRQTLVQWLTPQNMRGRVSSVNSMFIISSNEIGAFESGVAAQFLGLMPSVVFGGIGTIIVVAATAMISPKFRKLVVDAEKTA